MFISNTLLYKTRKYKYTRPDNTNKPTPLNVWLHGGTGSGQQFYEGLDLDSTLGENSINLYLTATLNEGGFTAWNSGGAFNPNASDVTYIMDIISKFKELFNIKEVNIGGHSNGAMMGYRLISERPQAFKRLFAMAGALMVDSPDLFTGEISHIHGLNDANVPYNGGVGINGVNYPSVADTLLSFSNASTSLNALANTGHELVLIKSGVAAQGTSLQLVISKFLGL